MEEHVNFALGKLLKVVQKEGLAFPFQTLFEYCHNLSSHLKMGHSDRDNTKTMTGSLCNSRQIPMLNLRYMIALY